MSPESRERTHKLTVNLPTSSHDALVELAKRRGTTRTIALARAVEDAAFFADQISQGNEIQVFNSASNQTTRLLWTGDYALRRDRDEEETL